MPEESDATTTATDTTDSTSKPDSTTDTRTEFEESADTLYGGKGGEKENAGGDEKPKEQDDKPADAKPEDSKADDTKDGKGDSKPDGPPEKYDLRVPDDSLLDESAVERIAAEAKKQGLSQDDAQDLLQRTARIVEDERDDRELMWSSQVKDDKELGGDNLSETISLAQTAIERFGSKDLRATLETTGYGSHPELIRFLRNVGKAMSEDKMVQARGSTEKKVEDRPIADVIYGNKET